MEKPKGDLKQGSPRHRLLTALHGFYRYQRTAGGEIDKIRQAFEKNVKKEKREVCVSVRLVSMMTCGVADGSS